MCRHLHRSLASSLAPIASCRNGNRSSPTSRPSTLHLRAFSSASSEKTTLGRFLTAAFISDADNLADLPKIREAQRKLSDPRLTTAQQRMALERNGKVVVLMTSSIHSPEVGGILTPLTLACRLATSEDAEARAICKNTVVIVVPSINPDRVDICSAHQSSRARRRGWM